MKNRESQYMRLMAVNTLSSNGLDDFKNLIPNPDEEFDFLLNYQCPEEYRYLLERDEYKDLFN